MTGQQLFRVMVTRPKPQGEDLCQYLQAQGYDTHYLPVIEIKPLSDLSLLREQIARLDQYDWAIFVSRSAVVMSQALIQEQWPQFPQHLRVAAIGEGTAQALKQAGLPVTIYPQAHWNSEGLLDRPELQNVRGKSLALLCGEGGRELLFSSLSARGAKVNRLVCYQRRLPQIDLKPSLDLLNSGRLDAILITSVESLSNLQKLFGQAEWPKLQKIPLVLVSERIMIQAKDLGFESCFLAKNASHDSIVQALKTIRK